MSTMIELSVILCFAVLQPWLNQYFVCVCFWNGIIYKRCDCKNYVFYIPMLLSLAELMSK